MCTCIASFFRYAETHFLLQKSYLKISAIYKKRIAQLIQSRTIRLCSLFFYLRYTKPRYFSKNTVSFAMIPFFFSVLSPPLLNVPEPILASSVLIFSGFVATPGYSRFFKFLPAFKFPHFFACHQSISTYRSIFPCILHHNLLH